jgi:oligoribonuclease
MKYVSIDLETTGLDPKKSDIIEFGAVIDDLNDPLPLNELPKFHAYVLPNPELGYYRGDPFALQMNQAILKAIATRKGNTKDKFVNPTDLTVGFLMFLQENGMDKEPFVAGKNYATFDGPFLEQIPNWKGLIKTHRRVLDPVMLYLRKTDQEPPRLSTCCERAGINSEVKHTAVDDALMVVDLIRKGLK